MLYDYDVLDKQNLRMTTAELREKELLINKIAAAGFNNQKIEELVHDILWVKTLNQISFELKAHIAARYSTFDDAVCWSFRYLTGDNLTRFARNRYLKLSMVPEAAKNENVSKEAISKFLNSYSFSAVKIAYVKDLALVNFTDDFFARLWEVTSRKLTDDFPLVVIDRFREKYELDKTVVPDSWVAHLLDEVVKSAKQRMHASWETNGLSGMDTVESVVQRNTRHGKGVLIRMDPRFDL